MKIIKTIDSDLHLRVQESMRKLLNITPEDLKRKQYQRRREAFMREVYKTLGWNIIPPAPAKEDDHG